MKNSRGIKFKALPKATATTKTTVTKYKVTVNELNIRAGAGTGYKITGVIYDKGTYEITTVKTVSKASWGKLKNGKGWICLDYCKKV